MVINGKTYPMWSQFVEKKNQFIGGILEDNGDDVDRSLYQWYATKERPCDRTVIKDIVLRPNGEHSAFFEVIGETFTCGFDVRTGGIVPGQNGWITFSGFGGHQFAIKQYEPPFKVGQYVTYNSGYGEPEKGRVKALHHVIKDSVWVVYKCGNNWDFFMNYTAQLTENKYLKHGWS